MRALVERPGSWQADWAQLAQGLLRVQSEAGERQLIDELSRPARPVSLAFANAHAMNSVATSRAFFEALRSADLVLRDGSGMALLFRLLRMQPGRNLNGTDLIPKIIRRHAGGRIALFGTQQPYLGRARKVVMGTLAPGSTCFTANGFLDSRDYVRLARADQPDLIVLGMGMPRQEEVARELRSALDHPCLIICGGAIIDFMGGKTPRAPRWIRALDLEWAYRLSREPRRLFRRYVLGNPLFVARAVRLAARARPLSLS
jgi:bacterial polymer biosynthesis proteins, WecB/TagA/CpsF family